MKKVAIIMGSDSDLPVLKPAIKTLAELEIPFSVRVMSAHRTPAEAAEFSRTAQMCIRDRDWTKPALSSWKAVLLDHSILPVQQYSYTTGKNSTDSAMIIDAMDILYSGQVDGFCLVSSDSDFTRLAARLRESGMIVVGMGEKKTPKSFIAACNRFRYLDVLAAAEQPRAAASVPLERTEKENRPSAGRVQTPAKAPAAKPAEKMCIRDRSDPVYCGPGILSGLLCRLADAARYPWGGVA